MITYRQLGRNVPITVAGYSEMRELDLGSYSKDPLGAEYDLEKMEFTFFKSLGAKETVDLSPFVAELDKKHSWSSQTDVPSADLVYETGAYKFVFKNFPVRNPKAENQDESRKYWSMNGYLFVK